MESDSRPTSTLASPLSLPQVLGPDHPDTATAASNLATLLGGDLSQVPLRPPASPPPSPCGGALAVRRTFHGLPLSLLRHPAAPAVGTVDP